MRWVTFNLFNVGLSRLMVSQSLMVKQIKGKANLLQVYFNCFHLICQMNFCLECLEPVYNLCTVLICEIKFQMHKL